MEVGHADQLQVQRQEHQRRPGNGPQNALQRGCGRKLGVSVIRNMCLQILILTAPASRKGGAVCASIVNAHCALTASLSPSVRWSHS